MSKYSGKILWADTEDFSTVSIKDGHHRYAEESEVLLFPFAFDDNDVEVWDIANGPHTLDDVQDLLSTAERVYFHNAPFDMAVLRHQGMDLPTEKVHCTMLQALAHGLVGKLDTLCDILHVPQDMAKLKDGKKLLQRFTKPRPKREKIRRHTKETHPEEWGQFVEYARLDVVSMRGVHARLPVWNNSDFERQLWLLDQEINDRGLHVDTDLSHAALRAFERVKGSLADATRELTGGAVNSATQREAFLTYINSAFGENVPDLTKDTVSRLLDDPSIDPTLRTLLGIRQQVSATSPAKHAALLKGVSKDGRLRGTLQFCGAARTKRDAGRIFQPQNLPRPSVGQERIDAAIDAMKADCEHLIYDDVYELVVSSIRGAISAAPGNKLIVSDLSNIEGRVAAWLADEVWKIKAFDDFDKGVGSDLYILAYARSFGVSVEEVLANKKEGGNWRQIGKVQELALQFQGAVGAFNSMAANYGVDLPEEEVVQIVQAWRAAHPRIKNYWYNLETAAYNAVRFPDESFTSGKLTLSMKDGHLRMRLPSGGYLTYINAHVEDGKVMYEGVDQYTRQWSDLKTYGGKLFENAVQGTARDVFFTGLLRIHRAGYPIIGRVHDEVICETPDSDEYTVGEVSRLLATQGDWMFGLPMSAAGFETYRYRKDD